MQFSSQGARPILYENSCKCSCGILTIICEICTWLNGYFTLSAVVPLSSSSAVVIRQYVKNPHLCILPVTSTDFLHKIHPQFTHCNICIYHCLVQYHSSLCHPLGGLDKPLNPKAINCIAC